MKLIGFMKKLYSKKIFRVIIAIIIVVVVAFMMMLAGSNTPENMVIDSIKFDHDSFVCQEGKIITINVSGEIEEATFVSYDNDIVEITKNEVEAKRCANCVVIDINCKKIGSTNIEANAINGNKAMAIVTVTK